MTMGKIIIEAKEYTFEQILKGNWTLSNPYFYKALSFCRDWLRGTDTFSLHTSGSTGIPKEIIVLRQQMEISAMATRDFFDIPDEADLLGCLNIEMIAGKMMLVRAMEWNANILLIQPSSNPLSNISLDQKFHFAAMVPLQLGACMDDPETVDKLPNIKNLIIGGAAINKNLKEKAALLPINVYQTFGMTETVSHVALAKIDADAELLYKALPGIRFSVTADDKLIISAPMAQEEQLVTNDIVELLSASTFIWKGRADFTINSGGIKVQPEELENQIQSTMDHFYPGCRFFIFGEKDKNFGEKICLVVEQEIHSPDRAENLLKELKETKPKHTVPKNIYRIASFVETSSGKINKPATLEKLQL